MAQYFNTTRGPLNATVDGAVLVFPSKAWTVVADSAGSSASLQSLVRQGLLIFAPGNKPIQNATSSKPLTPIAKAPPKAAPKAEAPKADLSPSSKDAASVSSSPQTLTIAAPTKN